MQPVLAGSWRLNPEKSEFDVYHRPRAGTLTFELDQQGHYLMQAEGVDEKGEKCAERPVKLILDGKQHPVPDFPGLTAVSKLTDRDTITSEVQREDGSVVGGGTYQVSADGTSLTVTNFGYDSQLRQFKQRTVWDRKSN
jgi:hypothetical protein